MCNISSTFATHMQVMSEFLTMLEISMRVILQYGSRHGPSSHLIAFWQGSTAQILKREEGIKLLRCRGVDLRHPDHPRLHSDVRNHDVTCFIFFYFLEETIWGLNLIPSIARDHWHWHSQRLVRRRAGGVRVVCFRCVGCFQASSHIGFQLLRFWLI